MNSLLIKGGQIVTMNPRRDIIRGDILIRGNRIARVGSPADIAVEPDVAQAETVDATGRVIIPGLIQTHVHLTQTIFRGLADDLALLDWLRLRIWPFEAAHTHETNYLSAKLGLAELIRGGTTAIVDMETVRHTDAAFEAVAETGMRAVIGKCMMDRGEGVPTGLLEAPEESARESERLLNKWHGRSDGRIQYAFAPRFAISCSEPLLLRVRDMARAYGVLVHTHASESRAEVELIKTERGVPNVAYFDRLGMTGPGLILAHCVWLSRRERRIIADTGTRVAHCPNSNLKLASGIAPIPELLEAGALVSLGADGAPCNNNLDMFQEMRTAALIQKARLIEPTAMPAELVFELATLGGARAIGREAELGSIEEGKLADLAILDLDKPHCSPATGNLTERLVYAARATDVETVVIDGHIVMRSRRLLTIGEASLLLEAGQAAARFSAGAAGPGH